MIARVTSIALLAYLVGFVLFAFTLGKPAGPGTPRTDAAIVLTGGSGRIEHAIFVLKAKMAKRVLISGADPIVTKKDLAERLGGDEKWLNCCVDLDSVSVDTRTNAEEADRWMAKHGYSSLRLITSDWHMRRSLYEFRKVLKGKYVIVPDAVQSEPGLMTLFAEYNKFILRRIAVWADL